MCGIVGVVEPFSRERCVEIQQKMNGEIVHRGPDDDGIGVNGGYKEIWVTGPLTFLRVTLAG